MKVAIKTIFTAERFQMKKSEVTQVLDELHDSTDNYKKLIEKIITEDTFIAIKLRAFKKSRRNFFLSSIAIGIGVYFGMTQPILYLFAIIGIIVFISSVIGMITNRLSRQKRKYITS